MKYKLSEATFEVKEEILPNSGIYKMIALDIEGKPRQINRLLSADDEGVLYIGKSENLQERIVKMQRAFKGYDRLKKPPHIAVRTILGNAKIQAAFPLDQICVAIEYTEGNESAKLMETRYLQEYHSKFGETPPLNRQSS